MRRIEEIGCRLRLLVADEDGAITVDWVVLTAALVTIAIVVIGVITPGVYDASSDIASGVLESTNF
ncbi:MAG: hypothetical protein AAFV27_05955 [Pseudomonadota bacterium]